jgi:hypothetical protein
MIKTCVETISGLDFLRATYLVDLTMVCGGDLRIILVEWPQGYIPGGFNHGMWW